MQWLEQEGDELRERHDHELERMEHSRELASHFESRLNAAFVQELRTTREAARNHPDATQRFYELLYARMLCSEIDRMYQGKRF